VHLFSMSSVATNHPLEKLPEVLRTDDCNRLLVDVVGARYTWTAGGCAVLALALKRLFPRGRLMRVESERCSMEHLAFLLHGMIIDGDGLFTPSDYIRRMERMGDLGYHPRLAPYDGLRRCRQNAVQCDAESVSEVAQFLAPRL
jgi:hypothetical protein